MLLPGDDAPDGLLDNHYGGRVAKIDLVDREIYTEYPDGCTGYTTYDIANQNQNLYFTRNPFY